MNRIALVLIVIVALMAAPAAMTQAPAGTARAVVVKAGRVLDVRTGKYATNQIIWIEGERIKEMATPRPSNRDCRKMRASWISRTPPSCLD